MVQDQPGKGLGQAEDWATASLQQGLPRVLDKAAGLAATSSRVISWKK